jgi:hypothetical protein
MLTVSINGEEPKEAKSIVVYDGGYPIAAVRQHDNMVIWADAARDMRDLVNLLNMLGVREQPKHVFSGTIKGKLE